MSTAREVAEAIINDAQSGMAVWDELSGSDAVLQERDGKFVITIPQEYDEQGEPTNHVVLITVEGGVLP